MDTVIQNKIDRTLANLEKITYVNPFVNSQIITLAKNIGVKTIPKLMGYNSCAPLGFYKNKMCELIIGDELTILSNEQNDHLAKIARSWNFMPHLIFVDAQDSTIISIKEFRKSKRKRTEQIEIPDLNWVSASSTRNYMLDDPIIDFLKKHTHTVTVTVTATHTHTHTHTPTQRPRSESETFLSKIFNNGNKFEEQIIDQIKQKVPKKDFIEVAKSFEAKSLKNHNLTKEAIKNKIPIIYQPVLWNYTNKTYGCADLIIRSDYAPKLFPSYELYSPYPENKEPVYEVYDIKWSIIKLKAASDHIQNEISLKPYKAQIWIYTDALNKIQQIPSTRGFVIGKTYTRERIKDKISTTQTYSDPFEKLGLIDFEHQIEKENIEKTNEAIQWLQEINTNKRLKLDPPNDPRLYPNMKNTSDSEYHQIKKTLAEKNKEITMLYSVGKRSRDLALDLGICRWDDPKINSNILGINQSSKLARLIDGIIEVNRPKNKTPIVYTHLTNFGNWKNAKIACYIDIETIGKAVYNLDIKKSNFIFMIGIGVVIDGIWEFNVYTAKSLDITEEHRIISEFNKRVKQINLLALKYKQAEIPLFHWSNYENTNLKPYVEIPKKFKFYDMCKWVKDDEIFIKGAFNFKLKSVTRALYNLKMGSVIWEDSVSEGLDAMHQAYMYYKFGGAENVLLDIEAYNEVDCKSMSEIHKVLTNCNIHD